MSLSLLCFSDPIYVIEFFLLLIYIISFKLIIRPDKQQRSEWEKFSVPTSALILEKMNHFSLKYLKLNSFTNGAFGRK